MLGNKLFQLVQIRKKASKYPKRNQYSSQDRIINSLKLAKGTDYKSNSFHQYGESITTISCLTIKRSGTSGKFLVWEGEMEGESSKQPPLPHPYPLFCPTRWGCACSDCPYSSLDSSWSPYEVEHAVSHICRSCGKDPPVRGRVSDANLSPSRRMRASEGEGSLWSPEATVRFDGEKMLDG